MAGPLRRIDDPALPAAANMAVDEALLLRGELPTLRFYAWRPHAVSLGWFQRVQDFADLPADVPVVRRKTGGGAIHHAEELTFSLACAADLLPKDIDESYRLLHDAVVVALCAVGVPAVRVEQGPAPSARPKDRWCFRWPGKNDIVGACGRKLCGSAQRRLHTAAGPRVLHHGSIVLARPSLTPFVAAVADHLDPQAAAKSLPDRIADEIARALRMEICPGALQPAERELATALQEAPPAQERPSHKA